jgi:hypothetical protein
VIRDTLLSQTQDAGVGYLWDPIENSRWHLLRGLPALQYLGISDFTYPTSWCQFNRGKRYTESAYEYHVVSGIPDVPTPEPEFGAITNKYYETETPYTIKHLIDRYTRTDQLLFVLADEKRLTPQGGRRPLYQEPFVDAIGSYESVYNAFAQAYREAGWKFPLSDTKNIYIQDNAILHEFVTGEVVSTTTKLFDRLPEAPFLPLYDAFMPIFGREDELGSSPLGGEDEIVELGRWLRRRIEWDRETAQEVARELNQAVIDEGDVFDRAAARRSPAVGKARDRAQGIDDEASPINQRYADWLTRYDL